MDKSLKVERTRIWNCLDNMIIVLMYVIWNIDLRYTGESIVVAHHKH